MGQRVSDRWHMRLFLSLIILSLSLPGCGPRIKIPKAGENFIPKGAGSAATPWDQIAYWGSALAALAVLLGIVALWIKPKLGQQVIEIAISVLVGCQIMLWIGAYLAWISLIILIAGLAFVSYRHKAEIIDYLDGPENDDDDVPPDVPDDGDTPEPQEIE